MPVLAPLLLMMLCPQTHIPTPPATYPPTHPHTRWNTVLPLTLGGGYLVEVNSLPPSARTDDTLEEIYFVDFTCIPHLCSIRGRVARHAPGIFSDLCPSGDLLGGCTQGAHLAQCA